MFKFAKNIILGAILGYILGFAFLAFVIYKLVQFAIFVLSGGTMHI